MDRQPRLEPLDRVQAVFMERTWAVGGRGVAIARDAVTMSEMTLPQATDHESAAPTTPTDRAEEAVEAGCLSGNLTI